MASGRYLDLSGTTWLEWTGVLSFVFTYTGLSAVFFVGQLSGWTDIPLGDPDDSHPVHLGRILGAVIPGIMMIGGIPFLTVFLGEFLFPQKFLDAQEKQHIAYERWGHRGKRTMTRLDRATRIGFGAPRSSMSGGEHATVYPVVAIGADGEFELSAPIWPQVARDLARRVALALEVPVDMSGQPD
jgi:hypothetical protein